MSHPVPPPGADAPQPPPVFRAPPGSPAFGAAPVPAPVRRPATLSYVALACGIASPLLTIVSFLTNNAFVLPYDSPIRGVVGSLPWLLGIAALVLGIVALARRCRARPAAIIGMILPAAAHLLLFFAWVLLFVGVMTAVGVSQG